MVAGKLSNTFQSLERRLLMAATPVTINYLNNVLTITGTAVNDTMAVTQNGSTWTVTDNGWSTTATYPAVTKLIVNGGDGADKITANTSVASSLVGGTGNDVLVGSNASDVLVGGDGNDSLVGNGGADKFFGGAGNDTLVGGDGADSLFGGTGNDSLSAGGGEDVLIAVGGGVASTLFGGDGADRFWLDDNSTETVKDLTAAEISVGAQHRISAFQALKGSAVSKDINATAPVLVDPTVAIGNATYRNFAGNPLFATNGPSVDDIKQGQVGDCYFLSQLASYAKINPALIKQAIVDLGDGSYAVQFKSNGANKFYRIDADLPSYNATITAAAGLGAQNSLWVALLEKAWTFARRGTGSYASIEAGWMSEVATAFGKTSTFADVNANSNADALAAQIQQALASGKSVTLGTNTSQASGSTLVGSHAYTVLSVQSDGAGGYTITVRNPWAVDGYRSADGSNDGLVTLTMSQFTTAVDALNLATA